MSKKGKNQDKKDVEFVQEQKDPMLRAFQKKVRNINKKLADIAELSLKKDLKPQQEEKINKKDQILLQKEKYLEIIQTYTEIAADNQKAIRKTQLVQLQDLASLIAMKEYNADLGFLFNQNVDNLVRVLTVPTSNELTLAERIKQISTSLVDAANNLKLKKKAKQYFETNANNKKAVNEAPSIQPQPISPRSQRQREAQIKNLEQELSNLKPLNEEPNEQPQEKVVEQTKPVVQIQYKYVELAKVQKEAKITQVEKPDEGQKQKDETKQRRYNKQYRGRGRAQGSQGQDNREGRNNDERKPYKKPVFKPKHDEEQKPRKDVERSSQSDSEPQQTSFKKEQIKELIQDGFTVVGKPKVKGRYQKEFHEHQHGNKFHKNHHTKKNY